MATALLMATRSSCGRLHVGCVLVSGGEHRNRIVAAGYNGFLPGTPHIVAPARRTRAGDRARRAERHHGRRAAGRQRGRRDGLRVALPLHQLREGAGRGRRPRRSSIHFDYNNDPLVARPADGRRGHRRPALSRPAPGASAAPGAHRRGGYRDIERFAPDLDPGPRRGPVPGFPARPARAAVPRPGAAVRCQGGRPRRADDARGEGRPDDERRAGHPAARHSRLRLVERGVARCGQRRPSHRVPAGDRPRRHLRSRADGARGVRHRRRGAREVRGVVAGGQLRSLPRAHVLDAEHQHLPRPAVGAWAGDVRGGPVSSPARSAPRSCEGCRATIPSSSRRRRARSTTRCTAGPRPSATASTRSSRTADLQETYLPAFKTLVGAGVEAVMCAYNRVNGEPACGSDFLIKDTLRGEWGFKGHVVSDCGAVYDFDTGHKVTANRTESAVEALRRRHEPRLRQRVPDARRRRADGLNLAEEGDRRIAVGVAAHPFQARPLRTGGHARPFANVSPDVIGSDAHRRVAREAAAQSIVLLKNTGGTLPISKQAPRIFVTGPLAADTGVAARQLLRRQRHPHDDPRGHHVGGQPVHDHRLSAGRVARPRQPQRRGIPSRPTQQRRHHHRRARDQPADGRRGGGVHCLADQRRPRRHRAAEEPAGLREGASHRRRGSSSSCSSAAAPSRRPRCRNSPTRCSSRGIRARKAGTPSPTCSSVTCRRQGVCR